MKYKATRRSVIESNTYVISVPYCKLQSLLSNIVPQAYVCSVDGLNADVYEIAEVGSNIAIVTGHRPFGNIEPSYELNKKYESLAKIYMKSITDTEKRRLTLNWLINQYVQEVLESEGK